MDVYKLAEVLSESNATEYKAVVEKLGPKLNMFINVSMKAKFPISNFYFQRFVNAYKRLKDVGPWLNI